MSWRDLFYFSEGERKVFLLILCLAAVSSVLLVIHTTTNGIAEPLPQAQYIVNPNNAPKPIEVDTSVPTKHTAPSYQRTKKYPEGTVIELNTADTTTLKMVPGIGSTFARRIVKFRDLLGGFYTVEQLREVYGIDEERYQQLQKWFHVDLNFIVQLPVNYLSSDSLARHPYLSYKQARSIYLIRKQKGKLSGWENLHLLDEFNSTDKQRLNAYLSFK